MSFRELHYAPIDIHYLNTVIKKPRPVVGEVFLTKQIILLRIVLLQLKV